MIRKQDCDCHDHDCGVSRRDFMQSIVAAGGALAGGREALAALRDPHNIIGTDQRFPYFQSTPVSCLNVTMNLVALQRGPLVYCIEEADTPVGSLHGYLPNDAPITPEHREPESC